MCCAVVRSGVITMRDESGIWREERGALCDQRESVSERRVCPAQPGAPKQPQAESREKTNHLPYRPLCFVQPHSAHRSATSLRTARMLLQQASDRYWLDAHMSCKWSCRLLSGLSEMPCCECLVSLAPAGVMKSLFHDVPTRDRARTQPGATLIVTSSMLAPSPAADLHHRHDDSVVRHW